jgi:thiamine-phosphate pyrophosphorylase
LTTHGLSECRLYGILDLSYVAPADVSRVARAMLDGGVDIVQLRAKNRAVEEIAGIAGVIHALTRERGVPLVINDHPDIARDVGAEGVHVGQDDLSVAQARQRAGANCFVGKSTHSIDQAVSAAQEGADYIGFGPLFATPTKPDYTPIGTDDIREAHARVHVPIFCIGGIKLNNLPQVIDAGARRAVIVSRLLQASDIAEYARAAKRLLARAPAASAL